MIFVSNVASIPFFFHDAGNTAVSGNVHCAISAPCLSSLQVAAGSEPGVKMGCGHPVRDGCIFEGMRKLRGSSVRPLRDG